MARKAKAAAPKLKPFAELAPSYQKRIRGYAKTHGITVRQARTAKHSQLSRGHKPGEAKRRAEREQRGKETLGKLTSREKSDVRAFYNANMAPAAARPGVSPSTVGSVEIAKSRDSFLERVTREGFAWFRDLRNMRNSTRTGDYNHSMAEWQDYLDTEWDFDEWHLWYQ
jgi:hypothetical protein